jgi:hypothetical protein
MQTWKNYEKIFKYLQLILAHNCYDNYQYLLHLNNIVGYGDIYPTTYFGRVLAIAACICGTFILSLLIVFLNSYISFDEVEKAVRLSLT